MIQVGGFAACVLLALAPAAAAQKTAYGLSNGKVLLEDGSGLSIVDPATGKPSTSLAIAFPEFFSGLSLDGKTAVVGVRGINAKQQYYLMGASMVGVPGLKKGKSLKKPFDPSLGEAQAVHPFPDGKRVLVQYAGGAAMAWDVTTEAKAFSLAAPVPGPFLWFLAEGRLVTANSKTATLWSLETGERLGDWDLGGRTLIAPYWNGKKELMALLDRSVSNGQGEFLVCAFGEATALKTVPAALNLNTGGPYAFDAQSGRVLVSRVSGMNLALYDFDSATEEVSGPYALTNDELQALYPRLPFGRGGQCWGLMANKPVRFDKGGIKK